MWKTMHNAYKVGAYWNNIPNFEQRSLCPICNEEESLEHILTDCQSQECKCIWELTRAIWLRKHNCWLTLKLGTILEAPSTLYPNAKENRPLLGVKRAYTILMTEAAHLI